MKNLRTLAAAILCILIGAGTITAQELNDAERKARAAMDNYLREEGYSTRIDKKDGSINFKKNNELYWITFNGSENAMCYTLCRQSIRFEGKNLPVEAANRKREIAEKAANTLNATQQYKAFLKDNKINFAYPIYATSPAEYQAVFKRVLKSLENIGPEFDKAYKSNIVKVDSIHNYWMSTDTTKKIVKQPRKAPVMGKENQGPNLKIMKYEACNADADGEEISGYDDALRQSKLKFIKTRLTIKPSKKGVFKIAMKIVTPDGKTLVPNRDATYTTVSTIEAKKTSPEEYTLDIFGTDKGGLWVPGNYKVYFYEDDREIYEDAFNVL